jgi:hypothetical protein
MKSTHIIHFCDVLVALFTHKKHSLLSITKGRPRTSITVGTVNTTMVCGFNLSICQHRNSFDIKNIKDYNRASAVQKIITDVVECRDTWYTKFTVN